MNRLTRYFRRMTHGERHRVLARTIPDADMFTIETITNGLRSAEQPPTIIHDDGFIDLSGRAYRIRERRELLADTNADRLADRQALAERLDACRQADGSVRVWDWGRDCDHYESGHLGTFRGGAFEFERTLYRKEMDAEGPWCFHPVHPDDVEEYEPVERDHVLEAHEDGHPWSVGL